MIFPASATLAPRLLFAESNTRFLCEVEPRHVDAFRATLAELPVGALGAVTQEPDLIIRGDQEAAPLVSADIFALKRQWQTPLAW